MPYLPDNVVSCCVSHLLDGEDKKAALVSLMSACGVCQQWRDVARRLEPGVLRFDSLKSCGRKELGRALTEAERRFRGSSALAKEAMFQSAAQLLHGYTHLVLCGEGRHRFHPRRSCARQRLQAALRRSQGAATAG